MKKLLAERQAAMGPAMSAALRDTLRAAALLTQPEAAKAAMEKCGLRQKLESKVQQMGDTLVGKPRASSAPRSWRSSCASGVSTRPRSRRRYETSALMTSAVFQVAGGEPLRALLGYLKGSPAAAHQALRQRLADVLKSAGEEVRLVWRIAPQAQEHANALLEQSGSASGGQGAKGPGAEARRAVGRTRTGGARRSGQLPLAFAREGDRRADQQQAERLE